MSWSVTPKHPDLIYDVGMHSARDTEFYLKKGFRVVAFEANPDLSRLGRERFKDFIDQGRLTIVDGAIVGREVIEAGETKVRFFKNDTFTEWGTVCADWAERNVRLGTTSTEVEVDAIDFVGTVEEHGVPHYLKIDIEGVDMVCVDALKQFRERPDYLSIESDKTSFDNLEGEINTLVELGYDSFQAVEQASIPRFQTPPNPAKEGGYAAHRFELGASGLFGAELGGRWKSRAEILRKYRVVRLGYRIAGDDGILSRSKLPGAKILRSAFCRSVRVFTREDIAGWYDTHARHSGATPHAAPGA